MAPKTLRQHLTLKIRKMCRIVLHAEHTANPSHQWLCPCTSQRELGREARTSFRTGTHLTTANGLRCVQRTNRTRPLSAEMRMCASARARETHLAVCGSKSSFFPSPRSGSQTNWKWKQLSVVRTTNDSPVVEYVRACVCDSLSYRIAFTIGSTT